MTEEQYFTKKPPEEEEELFKGNFIEEYTKRFMKVCDAPEIFIRASAYYIISATLGEFFENRLVPRGSRRPNVWVVFSSVPGRTRRSTVQMEAYDIVKKVIGEETVKQMIIESGSPEGVLDQIGEEPNSPYTIQSTEWGIVFTNMKKDEHYAVGMGSLFSKLKYGEGGKQSLSKRGGKEKVRWLPEGLYVTMLVGMQEAGLYFTDKQIRQGLPRRLLIIYVSVSGEIKSRWLEPIDEVRVQHNTQDLIAMLRDKRDRFMEMAQGKKIQVFIDDRARRKINEYSKKLDEKVDEKDLVSIYQQSLWEHLLTFATVNAIARKEPIQQQFEWKIDVSLKDVEAVEGMIRFVEEQMVGVIGNLGTIDVGVRVHRTTQQAVKWHIGTAGSEGIGFNELGKMFRGMDRDPLHKLVDNLVSYGDVEQFFMILPGAGRPPRVLVAKEHIAEFKRKYKGRFKEAELNK